MIERHPPQTLVEGDVLITNDPWLCAGHLYDIAIAVPVFRERRIVAFVGIVGHVAEMLPRHGDAILDVGDDAIDVRAGSGWAFPTCCPN